MIVTSLKKEYEKDLEAAVKAAIQKNNLVFKEAGGEEYYVEVYADYRDEFPKSAIKEIAEAEGENVMTVFEEAVDEMYYEAKISLWDELIDSICEDSEVVDIWEKLCNADRTIKKTSMDGYISDVAQEFVYVKLPTDDMLRQMVNVYIPIDSGNANYDFCRDNILNYYGNHEFENESSVLWLAKQQGKEFELRKAVDLYDGGHYENGEYIFREEEDDKFIESLMSEMENLPSSCATMIFLVKIKIGDLIELVELKNQGQCAGHIVLDKSTTCGLFDMWNGGGSCLDVQLEKDVEIPFDHIYDICVDGAKQHGYDVDEVYGLCGECWRESLKEVCTS